MKPLMSIASLSITGLPLVICCKPNLFTQLGNHRDHQYYKA